jgi:hypothetical protein
LLDNDVDERFAAKGFVAGLHIRQVQIGKHVRPQREKAVA